MALKVENNGTTLVVSNPSYSGVTALEHLGWVIVEGEKPHPPEPKGSGGVSSSSEGTSSGLESSEGPEGPAEEPEGSEGALEEPNGNASREVWAEYARSLGLEVPEDSKRDDVKSLVAQRKND